MSDGNRDEQKRDGRKVFTDGKNSRGGSKSVAQQKSKRRVFKTAAKEVRGARKRKLGNPVMQWTDTWKKGERRAEIELRG